MLIPELLAKGSLGGKTYSVPQVADAKPVNGLEGGNTPLQPSASTQATADDNSSELDSALAPESAPEIEIPTEMAESSALADAKSRGEEVVISNALHKVEEETVKKTLPALNMLIPKVPQEIQDALEDVFRAKWTRVMRVKKRDLSTL